MTAVSSPTWLHISDLHFNGKERFDRDLVLSALLSSLPDLISRAGKPDFVVVSGDIANSGRAIEYDQATEFFETLLATLGLDKAQLFVVPGNHDIDRQRGAGLARTLGSLVDSDDYFDSASPCLHVTERLRAFADWHTVFFKGIRDFPTNTSVSDEVMLEYSGRTISITGLNSAAFCFDDHDYGKLWLGRRAVDRIPETSTADLRLAVVHHPLDWMHQSEQPIVKASLRDRFDCILSGHLHQTDVESISGTFGSCVHLTAGASYQTSQWPNTAMFVSFESNQLKIFPIKFVESPRARWTVDSSIYPDEKDYVGVVSLSREASKQLPPVIHVQPSNEEASSLLDVKKAFEGDLFVAGNSPIYIEPRLMSRPQERSFVDDAHISRVSVDEVVSSSSSYIIETRAEYGGSTLCKRIEFELAKAGKAVSRKDARSMPNYKKKFETEFPKNHQLEQSSVLILDHFDFERDDRMLRELLATNWFTRVIIITVDRGLQPTRAVDPEMVERGFSYLYLWAIAREDVRQAAKHVFIGSSDAAISVIVGKAYDDLLALCIPLTPANVLMYLKVLDREGAFQPLNRVDIVGRYIADSIRTPSDAYRDTFNAKNRMDVLSAFVYQLYVDQRTYFDDVYWYAFLGKYKAETLTDFNEQLFLQELLEARIIGRFGRALFFKYSFFFTYFLGRQLAVRPSLITTFMDHDEYLRMGGVIDVVTGISSDNEAIVQRLVDDLDKRMDDFATTYVKLNFDPLEQAMWPDSNKEDEDLWKPIAQEIARGTNSPEEMDFLKTSVFAESRTMDQQVTFSKFNDLESAIFGTSVALTDALRNSDDIGGKVKLAAYDLILKTHLTAFQVGTLFSDELASRRFFTWGGIAFIDFDQAVRDSERGSPEARMAIIDALCMSVAQRTASDLGTAKLSAVFKARHEGAADVSFLEFMNFYCVLLSKGPNWDKTIVSMIERAGRNSFYLWAMLWALMENYKSGISIVKDRDSMKRMIAHIEAKRTHRKDTVGAKAVTSMLAHLESVKHFDEGNFGIRAGDSSDGEK